MPDELEERLKGHARAFDSLLSLIPAKLYYGEDVSDQWKRKKQTPEQKKAARIAKLDPDNWKSAKDIMDERAAAVVAKRKRDAEEDIDNNEGSSAEQPKAVQDQEKKKTKRRKINTEDGKSSDLNGQSLKPAAGDNQDEEERRQQKLAKKAAKRERKQAKQAKSREKKEKQRAKKKEVKSSRPRKVHKSTDGIDAISDEGDSDEDPAEALEIDATILNSNLEAHGDNESTAPSSSGAEASPILSPQIHSSTSSVSSILPPPISEPLLDSKSKRALAPIPSLRDHSSQTPKERLEARLSQLRAERKADGPDGRPARNRQELLEQRRKKEEERKAAKKEQRRKEKEEEARREDEEIAKRFSPGGSGSLLASPRSPMVESTNSFSFGRVAFEDGTQVDSTLTNFLEPHNPRGPADPATALKAAQNKAARLSGLDESKRTTIEQQDMWLNAKKKAHGERVRDDTSLLKKALKRKDGEKRKSEKEWGTRIEGVKFGQEKRQQRREENIQKRRDEKGSKGKKTKVKRPGFEGSFRGRTGGGKGKNKN